MENETNVAPGVTSPEPAKTAENESAGGARASSPGAAIELPGETPVSYPLHHHDVAQIDHLTPRIFAIIEESLRPQFDGIASDLTAQLDGIAMLRDKIEELKAELAVIRDYVIDRGPAYTSAPGVPTIVPADAKTTIGIEVSVKPHVLVLGDPVKVWGDPEHATFRLGVISAVESADGPYEVTLDDDSITRVSADGLEYDYRR